MRIDKPRKLLCFTAIIVSFLGGLSGYSAERGWSLGDIDEDKIVDADSGKINSVRKKLARNYFLQYGTQLPLPGLEHYFLSPKQWGALTERARRMVELDAMIIEDQKLSRDVLSPLPSKFTSDFTSAAEARAMKTTMEMIHLISSVFQDTLMDSGEYSDVQIQTMIGELRLQMLKTTKRSQPNYESQALTRLTRLRRFFANRVIQYDLALRDKYGTALRSPKNGDDREVIEAQRFFVESMLTSSMSDLSPEVLSNYAFWFYSTVSAMSASVAASSIIFNPDNAIVIISSVLLAFASAAPAAVNFVSKRVGEAAFLVPEFLRAGFQKRVQHRLLDFFWQGLADDLTQQWVLQSDDKSSQLPLEIRNWLHTLALSEKLSLRVESTLHFLTSLAKSRPTTGGGVEGGGGAQAGGGGVGARANLYPVIEVLKVPLAESLNGSRCSLIF